jgi:hypothetical protein
MVPQFQVSVWVSFAVEQAFDGPNMPGVTNRFALCAQS